MWCDVFGEGTWCESFSSGIVNKEDYDCYYTQMLNGMLSDWGEDDDVWNDQGDTMTIWFYIPNSSVVDRIQRRRQRRRQRHR